MGHSSALNYLVALYQLVASPQTLSLLVSIWGGWKGQGEGVKIQGSLANSPFIWLHVGVGFNISGIENALDCVLLKQSSSNIVLLRQSAHKYWKALNSESRQACLPRTEP